MILRTLMSGSPEHSKLSKTTNINGKYQTKRSVVLFLCLRGSATFEYEGIKRSIVPNTGVFIGRGFSFDIKDSSPDFKNIICVVAKESMDEILFGDVLYHFNRLVYRPRFFYMDKDLARLCRFIMERASAAANSNILFSDEISACYIKILMYTALGLNIRQSKEEMDNRENLITDRFIELCRANYQKTRILKDYAEMLGITPKYLSACVLKASGRHANEWLDDFLIHDIKTKLKENYMTIQQISYELNFATPSHLSHYFRSKTGTTPLEYRRLKKATPPPTPEFTENGNSKRRER